MNKGQRIIACLLTVVAVLLVVNLIAGGERAANAQAVSGFGSGGCCTTTNCIEGVDAQTCDAIGGFYLGDGTSCAGGTCNFEACCSPGDICFDGPPLWCINHRAGTPQGAGTTCGEVNCGDLPCPGDANDDRVIDFHDLLAVLDGWGPCDK